MSAPSWSRQDTPCSIATARRNALSAPTPRCAGSSANWSAATSTMPKDSWSSPSWPPGSVRERHMQRRSMPSCIPMWLRPLPVGPQNCRPTGRAGFQPALKSTGFQPASGRASFQPAIKSTGFQPANMTQAGSLRSQRLCSRLFPTSSSTACSSSSACRRSVCSSWSAPCSSSRDLTAWWTVRCSYT